jgi:hypothetical protein
MSFEQPPEGNFNYVGLDARVGQSPFPVLQHMEIFVTSKTIDSSEIFGYEGNRVTQTGTDLAWVYIGHRTTEQQVRTVQRSLRFGLQLIRQIDEGNLWADSLDAVQAATLQPAVLKAEVASSYYRYLSHNRQLLETLRDNLKRMAPHGDQLLAQNIISFVLEQAERINIEAYSHAAMGNFDHELKDIFDPPPEDPSE